MVGLTDIAPQKTKITVLGKPLEVRGLSMRDIAHLLGRFPALRMIVAGRQAALTFEDILGAAPDAIAAIIACGTGAREDADTEAVADTLPVEAQADIIEAVITASFPRGGFGPFVARLMDMARQFQGAVESAPPAKARVTNSPPPSNS